MIFHAYGETLNLTMLYDNLKKYNSFAKWAQETFIKFVSIINGI